MGAGDQKLIRCDQPSATLVSPGNFIHSSIIMLRMVMMRMTMMPAMMSMMTQMQEEEVLVAARK